jgi:hypothetical protein
MKRLNKFPRKLRNYTCIALVVGVLGWSGSGVGEDYYYNNAGQASANKGKGPNIEFSSLQGSSEVSDNKKNGLADSPISNPVLADNSPGGHERKDKEQSERVAVNPNNSSVVSPSPDSPAHEAPSAPSNPNSESKSENFAPEGLCGMQCDNDTQCDCASKAAGEPYKCCKKMGMDPGTGTCIPKDDICLDDGDSGDDDNPEGPNDPPAGGNSGGGDNGVSFCRADADCKNYGCDPDGNDNIVWPACNRVTGQCYCEALQKYECRNDADCATWWGKPQRDRSTGCDSASNFNPPEAIAVREKIAAISAADVMR